MKNSPFEEIITKAGQGPGLSTATRAQMRGALEAHMRLTRAVVPSPYQNIFALTFTTIARPALAFIAALLVVGVGSAGIAYAAEGALPGDTLYSVKVAVVEPIQTSFITEPVAKSAWKMQLAERRINEAATLANEGRLGTTTEVALAARFVAQAQASTTPNSVPTRIFTARLAAYDEVLGDIAKKRGSSQGATLRKAIRTQIALAMSTKPEATSAMNAAAKPAPSVVHTTVVVRATTTAAASPAPTTKSAAPTVPEEVTAALSAQARIEVLTRAAAQYNIDPFDSTTTRSWRGDGSATSTLNFQIK